jgi:hypothetical protein
MLGSVYDSTVSLKAQEKTITVVPGHKKTLQK